MVYNNLDTPEQKAKLAIAVPEMVGHCIDDTFTELDATTMVSPRAEIREAYVDLLERIGSRLTTFRMADDKQIWWQMRLRKCSLDTMMPNLQRLILINVSFVNSLKFLDNLKHLKALALDRIRASPDEYKFQLPRLGDRIESLSLAKNPSLNVYDLVYIVQFFKKLEFLDITGCTPFTCGAVETILVKCPNLTTFLFTPSYSYFSTRQWLDVCEDTFGHVIYSDETYSHLERYRQNLRSLTDEQAYILLDNDFINSGSDDDNDAHQLPDLP